MTPAKITDEAVEAATMELLAHGEFSCLGEVSNKANAQAAAKAAIEAALPHLSGVLDFDKRPSTGATTPEPCLREIVHGYYRQTFSVALSLDLTRKYLSALSSPAPDVVDHIPDLGKMVQSTPDATEELEVVGSIMYFPLSEERWDFVPSDFYEPSPGKNGWEDRLVRQSDALAIIEKLRAEIERWRSNSRDTFEAMVAMRNDINEHIPLPSLDSDLLTGPENCVFCARVAEAVVTEVEFQRKRAGRAETLWKADIDKWQDAEARLAEAVEALGKMHFYIAAHETELSAASMTREEALRDAYAAHDTFLQSLGKEAGHD